ncbi:MAG TPA: choice-of-anchor D domain-containing protein [bacterium]
MAAVSREIGRNNNGARWRARLCGGIALALVLILGAGQALAAQVTLAWDANTEPDVTGYKVYYGTASGVYGTPIDAGNVTTYTVTGLTDGTTYYFAATAYDSVGNESGYSNEVPYTVPGVPDVNVLGNAVVIVDGDTTPSAADQTDFGTAGVGGAAVTRTYTIRNVGTGPLTLSGTPLVAIGGANAADFTVTAQPTTPVAAGASTTFTVSFVAGAAGTRSATISIATNVAAKNPYDFAIQGAGATAPAMSVLGKGTAIPDGDVAPSSTDDTDFGKTKLTGGVMTHTFTIRNTGTAALTLSGAPLVAVSGANAADFTVTVQPSATIAAGASTTFTVSFDPSVAGTRTATLSIANNDAGKNPYDFAVQGIGVAPPGAPKNVRSN